MFNSASTRASDQVCEARRVGVVFRQTSREVLSRAVSKPSVVAQETGTPNPLTSRHAFVAAAHRARMTFVGEPGHDRCCPPQRQNMESMLCRQLVPLGFGFEVSMRVHSAVFPLAVMCP